MNKLSPEIISLIHYVKLNEAGWREKAVQNFIISIFGHKNNSPLTKEETYQFFIDEINNEINKELFNKQIEILRSSKIIIPIENKFILSEEKYADYKLQFNNQIEIESETYKLFSSICFRNLPNLSSREIWDDFNKNLLLPIIEQIGAKTNQWINGTEEIGIIDYPQYLNFLKKYERDKVKLNESILEFLDFKNRFVKKYVLTQRDAYFFVQSTSLKDDELDKIYKSAKAQKSLRVFVDTNFLLTLLDLHDNPSNEATHALIELLSEIKNKVDIKFYILPITVSELHNLLIKFKEYLRRIRPNLNYAIAVENSTEFSGILKKYFERCVKINSIIDLNDYFDPYLTDFTVTIRKKGLEVFNANLDNYSTDPRVLDDILQQTDYRLNRINEAEKKKSMSKEDIEFERIRMYDRFNHDCQLWYIVRDKRPRYNDSPKDMTDWVVTLDYGLLAFDRFKQKTDKATNVGVCLHPNDLISMIQFWVPRTEKFENAILGNLRLPFLFKEFDTESEKVSIEILKALSYYEGSDEFSSDQIVEILTNNVLRQKIKPTNSVEVNAELIKEEIFRKYEESQQKLKVAESENSDLKIELQSVKSTIDALSGKLDQLSEDIKRKAEEELLNYQRNKIKEFELYKISLEREIETLKLRHEDFENLLKRAENEYSSISNTLSFKVRSVFNGEGWQKSFKSNLISKYLEIDKANEVLGKLNSLKNQHQTLMIPRIDEKIIVFCENQNAITFNKLGFHRIHFQPERDSSGVFIKTIANETYFGLRDRDFLSDNEIIRIQEKYQNYMILNYYCFENYLYHPDNIRELNLNDFDLEYYTKDLIAQKNRIKDTILTTIKMSRRSYQEFLIADNKFQDKDESSLISNLNSDDVEQFLKSYSLKDKYFNKKLLEKYNLSESQLTNTNWFKNKIGEIISIKKN